MYCFSSARLNKVYKRKDINPQNEPRTAIHHQNLLEVGISRLLRTAMKFFVIITLGQVNFDSSYDVIHNWYLVPKYYRPFFSTMSSRI